MRYWPKRLMIYLRFLVSARRARELELALQKIEQDLHDKVLENQVHGNRAELEVEYRKGFNDGVKWCLEKALSL